MTFVDEMFTTAGNTAFTTGANVVGMDKLSRTGGAAAATAAAGAWPAWTMEAPTNAPPATDPMHNMSAAMIQTGYLFIRFMVIYVLWVLFLMPQKNKTDEVQVRKKILMTNLNRLEFC
jgi:hypothetical protein